MTNQKPKRITKKERVLRPLSNFEDDSNFSFSYSSNIDRRLFSLFTINDSSSISDSLVLDIISPDSQVVGDSAMYIAKRDT